MNIMQKVTWKCMCKNKKRTLVTMIGITICVAMISAVCILAASFQDVMMRNAKEMYGDYDLAIQLSDAQKMETLKQDTHFSATTRIAMLGSASLNEGEFHIRNTYQTQLQLFSMDVEHMDMIGSKLWKGTLPKTKDDIMIAKSLMNDKGFSYHIGDQITLPLYKTEYDEIQEKDIRTPLETRTFTITGIFEPSLSQSGKGFYAYTTYQPSSLHQYQLFIKLHSAKNAQGQMEEISKAYQLSEDDISMNDTLMFYSGNGDQGMTRTIFRVCIILFLIILIGGVSLIYNAFSISLSERSRQLGMLASIGATRSQKRMSVFFEATILAIITIPLGILSSIIGLWITFQLINPYFRTASDNLHVVVNGWGIGFTIVFTLFILMLSAWLPAKRAASTSPVAAIRQNKQIHIHRNRTRKQTLTQYLFGIEGELGLKNMKRNRSRYYATLFSLIICILLFMSSSYFSQRMQDSYRMSKTEINSDVALYMNTRKDMDEEIQQMQMPESEALQSLLHASKANASTYYLEATLYYGEDMRFREEAKQFLRKAYHFEGDVGPYESMFPAIFMTVLDDEDFDQYCESQNIDAKEFHTNEEPSIILVNKQSAKYPDQKKYEMINWLDVKEQETLHFRTMEDYLNTSDISNQERATQHVRVAHLSSTAPDLDYGNAPRIIMVMNMRNFDILNENIKQSGRSQLQPILSFRYQSSYPDQLEQELTTILETYGLQDRGFLENFHARRVESEQQRLLLNVMLYGFLTLIVLICTANIMNTVSTSIHLRKREFAMIRSIGITKKKFYKMIAFEVLFYGIKACLYGIPLGFMATTLLHYFFQFTFYTSFFVDWFQLLIMIFVLFLILSIAMFYAIRKIQHDNIVETIRQESI